MTSVDFLTGAWPTEVEVAGRPVPIRCGWRRAVRSMHYGADGMGMLASWFGRGGRVDPWAMAHAGEAIEAAVAWRDDALAAALPYGEGRRPQGRTFDWEADSAIVVADFARLYGIDLRSWQAHWYHFAALWSALAATEGSLVGEAMRARTPARPGADAWERKARAAAARAWALPVPESELARRINERIAREW